MEGTPAVYFSLSLSLSLPWLYLTSIIKINRPISYVKYYPRARLNILSLSTLPPTLPSFFSPASTGKGRTKSGGRKSVEGAARDSVLLRRVLLLVSPLEFRAFELRGWGSNIVAVNMRSSCDSTYIFSFLSFSFPFDPSFLSDSSLTDRLPSLNQQPISCEK